MRIVIIIASPLLSFVLLFLNVSAPFWKGAEMSQLSLVPGEMVEACKIFGLHCILRMREGPL
eukprot:231679-Karenia_brevis.AAC.1